MENGYWMQAVQDSNTGVLNFRGKIRYHNMEERIKMIKRKPKNRKGILLAAVASDVRELPQSRYWHMKARRLYTMKNLKLEKY